jgi:hypothetical protein
MSWDKHATAQRPRGSEPPKLMGVNVVYLGVASDAAAAGVSDGGSPAMGDVFRLLPGAVITFGRSELCEVTIKSEQLSQAHSLISILPGQEPKLVLADLRSRNGTWVGQRNAPVHMLEVGGEFSLARAFRFRCQPVG